MEAIIGFSMVIIAILTGKLSKPRLAMFFNRVLGVSCETCTKNYVDSL